MEALRYWMEPGSLAGSASCRDAATFPGGGGNEYEESRLAILPAEIRRKRASRRPATAPLGIRRGRACMPQRRREYICSSLSGKFSRVLNGLACLWTG